MSKRFMWWNPITLTSPFRPAVGRGCDEWHNPSVYLIVPALGGFVFFYGRNFTREGEVHLYSNTPPTGRFDPGCRICVEARADMEFPS